MKERGVALPADHNKTADQKGHSRVGTRITVRLVLEVVILVVCTGAFVLNAAGIAVTLLTDRYAGDRDFVTYWSSGHQLVHRQNPYDGPAILKMERSVGFSPSLPPLIMRNLPSSLILVLPLGLLGIKAASLFWSALMLIALWLSMRMISAMQGRPPGDWRNVLGYSFAPVLSCLIAGQMGLFVLLGLVLFLRFYDTRPFTAGAALWLCALKPHLFLPFCVVLLAWIVMAKQYRILAGATAAFAASTGVALLLDPQVFPHYSHMMKAADLSSQLIPCVSTMIRLSIDPKAVWLQWMPAAIGCVWGLIYFRRHWNWDWREHGSMLMLVSLVVAPYSWFMDQPVLLPALMAGLYRNRSRSLVVIFALLSMVIEVANLRGVPLGNTHLYPWTAPAWVIWYILATRTRASTPRASLQTQALTLAQEESA